MPWARVDDQWWSHAKVMGLSLEARGLWITALSWSCAHRRDVVPPSLIEMVSASPDVAAELVAAGLWIDEANGYRIHDWQEYQQQTLSEKRAEAGRKGGLRSGETRSKPKQETSKTRSQPKVVDEASGEANTKQAPKQVPRPDPSQPDPESSGVSVIAMDRDSRGESSSPSAAQNGRNPYYDAVCIALDMPERGDHEGMFGRIATKAKNGGHDPEEIPRRVALHLATFDFALTPGSLLKRWDELGSKVVTASPAERKKIQQGLERYRRQLQLLGGET